MSDESSELRQRRAADVKEFWQSAGGVEYRKRLEDIRQRLVREVFGCQVSKLDFEAVKTAVTTYQQSQAMERLLKTIVEEGKDSE